MCLEDVHESKNIGKQVHKKPQARVCSHAEQIRNIHAEHTPVSTCESSKLNGRDMKHTRRIAKAAQVWQLAKHPKGEQHA